ncbi:MAG: HAD family hydrolase [Acidimicrobiia bacterium]
MATPAAVLLDVYQTVLRVDFGRVERTLAEVADVPLRSFAEALGTVAPAVTIGALTMADALDRALRSCGAKRSPSVIADLVSVDGRSLFDAATVYDDLVPFLATLRSLGVRVAFVSNCAENTRPLLDRLGLTELVDALILSCEVGAAKPSAAMFERALSVLEVEPSRALLVDDQSEYCDAATAFGLSAIRIARGDSCDDQSADDLLIRFSTYSCRALCAARTTIHNFCGALWCVPTTRANVRHSTWR